MSFFLQITKRAQKEMRKIPKKDLSRIIEIIESMKTDPFIGDRQKIGGREKEHRRRIGSWRIFFHCDLEHKTITINHVRRKTSNTYSK